MAESCSGGDGARGGNPTDLRTAFIDPGGSEPVRLLLEGTLIQPGESLAFAPLNESSAKILYGLRAHVEDPESGEALPGPGSGGFFLIGLTAAPGEVGACVSIDLPNSTPPGEYLIALDDVSGKDFPRADVKAAFTVGEQPLRTDVLVPAGITEVENSVEVLYEPADTGQPMAPKDITKPGGPPTRIVTICAEDSPREGDVDELLLNVKPGVVDRVAKEVLGDRIAGGAIDRRICPPVYRLIIHEGVEADVEPVLRALEQRSGIDAGRVAIDSSPYTMKELKEAADRAARVLRDEPIDSWGVSYDETRGRIGVEAPELRVEAFERIERTAGVPVRFAIASGPAKSG